MITGEFTGLFVCNRALTDCERKGIEEMLAKKDPEVICPDIVRIPWWKVILGFFTLGLCSCHLPDDSIVEIIKFKDLEPWMENYTSSSNEVSVRIVEVNGIPVDFLESIEQWKSGNVSDMFNEEGELNEQ